MNGAEDSSHTISCPHCAMRCKYSDAHIGKKARCPKCGQTFSLPPPPPPPSPIRERQTFDREPKFEVEPVDVAAKHRSKSSNVKMTSGRKFVIVIAAVGVVLLALTLLRQLSSASDSSDLNIGMAIFYVVGLVVFVTLFFAPSIVALVREHQNAMPIFILNLLLGWTFVAWVICLVWSFTSDVRESRQYIRQVVITDPKAEDE